MDGWSEDGARQWVRGTRTPSSNTGAAKAVKGRWFMYLETSGGSKDTTSGLLSPWYTTIARYSYAAPEAVVPDLPCDGVWGAPATVRAGLAAACPTGRPKPLQSRCSAWLQRAPVTGWLYVYGKS